VTMGQLYEHSLRTAKRTVEAGEEVEGTGEHGWEWE
jgi:hypothetical protein